MEHLVHSCISSCYTTTSYTLFNALIASIIIITTSFPIPPRYFVSHSVKRLNGTSGTRNNSKDRAKSSRKLCISSTFPVTFMFILSITPPLLVVREIMVTNSADLSKIFITTGFHAQWGALRYALRFRLSRSHLFAFSTSSTRTSLASYFILEHSGFQKSFLVSHGAYPAEFY